MQLFPRIELSYLQEWLRRSNRKQLILRGARHFLDEVQKTPEVLASLRYFYEEMPELPVIAIG